MNNLAEIKRLVDKTLEGKVEFLQELRQVKQLLENAERPLAKKSQICKGALEKWGSMLQIILTFEEMAELQKELSKKLRGTENTTSIAEEVADLEIMLLQMKILFCIKEETGKHKNQITEFEIATVFKAMAELQKELSDNMLGENNKLEIEEKIIEVEIILDYLKILFEIESQVEKFKQYKLERLQERLLKTK